MTANTKPDLLTILETRGYLHQCTNIDKLAAQLSSGEKITFYLGIDPTADSLHIGHFCALMMFRYLQEAGHKGILLIGGATALVGDPTGKSDMRQMLSKEQVEFNLKEVRDLAKQFIITEGENAAIFVNNDDWMKTHTYVDFLRLVGVHFNINTMLAAEAYANRLAEGGLTYLEMGYMLMQAYDFIYLKERYGCTLQIGGSDQWGNIVAGTTLNRKMCFMETNDVTSADRNEIIGLTCPLLLTKDGVKMGKTESGTLWVARDKTTAYDFYQYFYNVDDADVDMLLRMFSRIDLDEIRTLCDTDIIKAKRTMAYEITKLVHGEKEASAVLEAVASLFDSDSTGENAPESAYAVSGNEINVVDLFFNAGFVGTKSDARRLIRQGGASVDGLRVASAEDIVKKPADKGFVLLKKGKRNYLKVRFM